MKRGLLWIIPILATTLLPLLGNAANDFWTHGSFPSAGSPATSASMRAELDAISAGFDKLPGLTGNGNKVVVVNSGGTALTVGQQLIMGGNLTISGAYATTITVTGTTTVTLPTSGTLATLAGTETLTNKTFSLGSNTLSGTTAQFNTALSDNDFATLAGTETLTNKTLTSPIIGTIVNTGTLTLPTATDTLVGRATTDTLTNKTLTAAILSGTFTGTYTLAGTPSLTSPTITTGTVAADPVTALGVASKQYVDALWTTGDVKLTIKTTADSGWILMNDGTIGDATSGGTTRANADTSALFTLMWTNCADADCPVSSGRGASAAADFSAHKTIALPKALGRALAVYGAGSGLTSRNLGSKVGEESHALSIGEMPAHDHSVGGKYAMGAGGNTNTVGGSGVISSTANLISSQGSGTAHNVMQPTVFLNVMMKL